MPIGRSAKIVVLATLLIAAGSFFGRASQEISQQYHLLLSLDRDFLQALLWLLLSMAAVAVSGGLVAALVRPLRIAILAFAVSALGAFVAWELSLTSAVVALIYFAVSLLYTRGVAEALDNRLKFSVEPISGSQSTLLAGLAIAACVGIYFRYSAEIEEQGFVFPPAIRDVMSEMTMTLMTAQIEARADPSSVERDAMLAEMTEGVEQWLVSMEEMIKPYEKFMPMIVAFMLFQFLAVINTLFSWIPIVILAAIFPILTSFGVVKKTMETKEVERLSMG